MQHIYRAVLIVLAALAGITACGGGGGSGGSDPVSPPPPAPVVPGISVLDAQVAEGPSGGNTANFSIELSESTTAAVSVEYSTSDGSASAGVDYVSASGRVDFAAGQIRQTVSIEIIDDSENELDEDFSIQLSNASGATIVTSQALATIEDDDIEAPSGLQVSDSFGEITASWQSVSNADSYTVYRARQSGVTANNWSQLDGGRRYVVTGQSLTMRGAPQVDYYFTVVATKKTYNSVEAGEVSGQITEGPETLRINVDSTGVEANARSDHQSQQISGDGRYIAFCSGASNLVAGDTNGVWDVFVHDRLWGGTELVSRASDGSQSNGNCHAAMAISGDGNIVVFSSEASNLTPDDTDTDWDLFVRDRVAGTTRRLTVLSDGSDLFPPNSGSFVDSVAISPDGRYVAMSTANTEIDPLPPNTVGINVFVHDRASATTERLFTRPAGSHIGSASRVGISADGQKVIFQSGGSEIVPGDNNFEGDVFLHDRNTGITNIVSLSANGSQPNKESIAAGISEDGRYIAFITGADNVVPNDLNGLFDVFWRDTITGEVRRVSVSSDGTEAAPGVISGAEARISGNGQFVAYFHRSENLVPDDENGVGDIYVYSIETSETSIVSLGSEGDQTSTPGTNINGNPRISRDGRFVGFYSEDDGLVANDTNGVMDFFVRGPLYKLETPTPTWPNTVVVGDKEWRQVTETTGFTWSEVANVCDTATGACSGALGSVDFSGWIWASALDLGEMFSLLTPHPGDLSQYTEQGSLWAPDFFLKFNATEIRTDRTYIRGLTRTTYQSTSGPPVQAYAGIVSDLSDPSNSDNVTNIDNANLGFLYDATGVWLYRPVSIP